MTFYSYYGLACHHFDKIIIIIWTLYLIGYNYDLVICEVMFYKILKVCYSYYSYIFIVIYIIHQRIFLFSNVAEMALKGQK